MTINKINFLNLFQHLTVCEETLKQVQGDVTIFYV